MTGARRLASESAFVLERAARLAKGFVVSQEHSEAGVYREARLHRGLDGATIVIVWDRDVRPRPSTAIAHVLVALVALLVVVLAPRAAYAREPKARAPFGRQSDGAHDQRGTSSMASKKTTPRRAARKPLGPVDGKAHALATTLRDRINAGKLDDETADMADHLVLHLEAPETAAAISAMRAFLSRGSERQSTSVGTRTLGLLAELLGIEALPEERLLRYAVRRLTPRAPRPGEEETRAAAIALLDRFRRYGTDTASLAAGHVVAAVHLLLSEGQSDTGARRSDRLFEMHKLARAELRDIGASELFVPVEDARDHASPFSLAGPFNALVPEALDLLRRTRRAPKEPASGIASAFAFVSTLHELVPGLWHAESLERLTLQMEQAKYLGERVVSLQEGRRNATTDAEDLVREMLERALRDSGASRATIRRRTQFLRAKKTRA